MRGMLQYKDLDLIKLRKKCDIDFAHYTFQKGMCSCCYGADDLPKRYWRDGIVRTDNYSYILFKNADNGSGHVTREDYLSSKDSIYILWDLNETQLDAVLKELEAQVGSEFIVKRPEDKSRCIELKRKEDIEPPIRRRYY